MVFPLAKRSGLVLFFPQNEGDNRMNRGACLAVTVSLLASSPAFAGDSILPDQSLTPGAIDTTVRGTEICTKTWAKGSPPTQDGTMTYSKAARATPQSVKEEAFQEYGLQDPHDNGHSYEVDHRVPLSLGGLDDIENLWPQSRTATGYNAWVKDRLELRIYDIVCHPTEGGPHLTLKQAQALFLEDWTKAYEQYCGDDEEACPAYEQSH